MPPLTKTTSFRAKTLQSPAALERRPGYGYSGELRDRAGHLPYGYRTYDPAGSRWLSPDPLGRRGSARLSLNAYQMVNRNPVSQRDVFGLVEYDPNFLMGGMMREDGALFDLVIQTLVSLMVNKHAMRVPREVQSLIQKYSPHDSAPYHPKYFALGGNAPRLSRYSDLGNGDDAGRLARVFIRDHIENGFQTHETLHSTKDFMGPMINLLASQVMFDHQQWKANAGRVPNHLARIRRFTLLRGLFGTLAIPDHHGDLYEENSFLGSLKTLKLSQLDLSGLNASFKFVTSSKKTIWRDLKSAYFAERAFFRRGLTRQLYDLGFTNVDGAFELSESILSQEDYRFENIASRSRQEKQGRWFKHLDFGWEEIERQKKRLKQRQKLASLKSRRGLQTQGKKKVRFFRVYKQKHLSKDQIKKIKRHHRELHERQLMASKSIDRRALPPQEIPYAQFYNTWSDYRSTTPSSVGISKPSKSKPPELNVHLAKNRSRYTFAYPILHSGLREKDRQYIFNHMQRDIWVSLQFGATGRHKNVNTGRHHEHLFTGKGVFSFAYILTGTYDRLNKRPYARAVIYNYAKGKQKNQSKTHYEWVYQPDFKTPGPRQGGPPKLPFDLKAIMIGATSQAPKSQKSGSQKTKNQRPKSRKKR